MLFSLGEESIFMFGNGHKATVDTAPPAGGLNGPTGPALTSDAPLTIDPDRTDWLLPQDWVRFGAVPVQGGLIALSDPEMITRLAVALTGKRGWRAILAVPTAIEALHHQHFGAALARRAETRVPLWLSSRGFGQRISRDRLQMPLLTLSGIMFSVAAPSKAAVALTAWCIFTLLCVTLLKLSCVTASLISRRKTVQPTPLAEDELPILSIMVPLHREAQIAERLVRRMTRLDYPADKRDILFVTEENDTKTREALDRAQPLPEGFRIIVVPDGHPKTKPRALNYALDFCRGSIVGVYDAEDAPEADQLRKVAAAFAAAPPEVVCLQGRLDYYNPRDNWLSRCFTTEYAAWFRLILPGLSALRLAVPLGGTTLFVRRHALEELGAWDAHNVTEDADLGIRLARRGWRTELIPTTTMEEANCRTWPWIKQRSRWIKGYMVTYLVHMRNPFRLVRELGLWQFIGFQVFFVASISQFLLAPLIWSFWLLPFGVNHPVIGILGHEGTIALIVLFLTCEVVNLLTSFVALTGQHLRHLVPWAIFMPLYFPLATPAAFKAAYELALRPFYWDKTAHGISGSED
ncbi:glycosyltransferase [Donghicola sp. B5-SW-15]|uniref:Glycosyltransferase n=2 Tax=Donghicola mangrovi TaxID=2729614 RepID=A0A850Q4D0_9RHOB|nr:glycosyltransferase [Donghicola mangrovi]